MYWIDKCDFEISGLGIIEVIEGIPYVTDVFLIDQENTATSTDLKPESVNRAMYDRRNDQGEIKFWWHSHVNMGVFWSDTDKETITELGKNGWFISTVFNKKREYKTAISTFEPFAFMMDDVKTQIVSSMPDSIKTALDQEYDSKVKTKTYIYNEHTSWKAGSEWDYLKKKWIEKTTKTDLLLENGKGAPPDDDDELDLQAMGFGPEDIKEYRKYRELEENYGN